MDPIIEVAKSDPLAEFFRGKGNRFFQVKDYFEGLKAYNQSICFAKSKKVLSLGYANRSAVYIELKLFEDCLKNIEWARENDYPKTKLSKLDAREKMCKELMKQQKEKESKNLWNFFKLSYPPNKKIPSIVDCIEMRRTEKYGRGIYATKDLKAGDVIAIDEPIIQLARLDSFHKYCNNCLKVCNLNLIPCSETAFLMYCCFECRDKVDAIKHTVEMTKIHQRLLTSLTKFVGGRDNLLKHLKNTNDAEFDKSLFEFDWSDYTDPNYNTNLITCLFSLQHDADDVSLEFLFFESLTKYTEYVPITLVSFIIGLLTHSVFHHCYQDRRFIHQYDTIYISLFNGLINHCCLNNVEFYTVDNKVVTVVCKPIKAGEQIFSSYYKSKNSGESTFQEIRFDCDCGQCKEQNGPPQLLMFRNLNITRDKFLKLMDFLKEGLDYVNNNSQSSQKLEYYKNRNDVILKSLAYFCTFPY